MTIATGLSNGCWTKRFAVCLCFVFMASFASATDLTEKLYQMRRYELNKYVPQCLKRYYREKSSETSCMDKKLGSLPLRIRRKQTLRFTLKSRIPEIQKNLVKVEFWIEFHKKGKHSRSNDTYMAFLYPTDIRLAPYRTLSENFVVSKGFTEISFNVTDFYLKMKDQGKNSTNIRLRLRKRPTKSCNELRGGTVKAFFVFHEIDYTCKSASITHTTRVKKGLDLKPRRSPLDLMRSMGGRKKVLNDGNNKCSLKEWYVRFDEIGWDEFVLYPTFVMAKKCTGSCYFLPMDRGLNMTAHARLKNFVLGLVGGDYRPCCVPYQMEALTMLAVEKGDEDIISVRSVANMIATSCACF